MKKNFSGEFGDWCIIYGSDKEIRAYHPGSMKRPYVIAGRPGHVTSIASVDGEVYGVDGGLLDCGHYKTVNETLTGKPVGGKKEHSIFWVGGYDGRIVAVEGDNEGNMFDVKSDKTFFKFEGGKGHAFYMTLGKDGILGGKAIYYANERASVMERGTRGNLVKKTLTGYLGNHVPLAADINGDVFCLSYTEPASPERNIVRNVNDGKVLASWAVKEGPDFLGHSVFFTFDAANNIVTGNHEYRPSAGNHLLYVDISDGTSDESCAANLEPQLLLQNAFEKPRYCAGWGNPITIIPFGQAEQFLRHAKKA